MLAPPASRWVAKLWRKVCGLTSLSIPAAAAEEETNIALGKSYTTFTEAAIENGFPKQVTDNNGELTDGNSASNVIGDPNWVQFYRGVFTGVTIDLGEESCPIS